MNGNCTDFQSVYEGLRLFICITNSTIFEININNTATSIKVVTNTIRITIISKEQNNWK